KLYVGYTISQDGGKTWTKGKELAGPMELTWLPQSQNGLMVADYLAVAYANGNPFGVFAVAKTPSGGLFNEAMYTTKAPLLPGENMFGNIMTTMEGTPSRLRNKCDLRSRSRV